MIPVEHYWKSNLICVALIPNLIRLTVIFETHSNNTRYSLRFPSSWRRSWRVGTSNRGPRTTHGLGIRKLVSFFLIIIIVHCQKKEHLLILCLYFYGRCSLIFYRKRYHFYVPVNIIISFYHLWQKIALFSFSKISIF